MKIEDIKKINTLDKNKFYLFRIGSDVWDLIHIKRFKEVLREEHIEGIIIVADDFEVIEIDKATYKLVKDK